MAPLGRGHRRTSARAACTRHLAVALLWLLATSPQGVACWETEVQQLTSNSTLMTLGNDQQMTTVAADAHFTRPLRRSKRGSSLVMVHHRLSARHEFRMNRTRLMQQSRFCKQPDKNGMMNNPWSSNLDPSECLGQGGFGQVWSVCFKSCSDLENKCAALKLVRRDEKHPRTRFTQALQREKACLTMFGGGPFIQMYGYSGGAESDDLAYFLMEQAEGGDASKIGSLFSFNDDGDLIRGGSALHRRDVALLFYDMVDGLQRMHSKGIVHRDVKAGNLFVTQPCGSRGLQCRGKLSDFGLVCGMDQISGSTLDSLLQRCNDIVGGGTRLWWSPEHGADISPSSKLDIWGGGMVLYKMIFGDWPSTYDPSDGREKLAASIKKFNIDDDRNFQMFGLRATSLGPLLGAYYNLLGGILRVMLAADPNSRPEAESILRRARKLCDMCGVNPDSRKHPQDREMAKCVEESSPGTSISNSGFGGSVQ